MRGGIALTMGMLNKKTIKSTLIYFVGNVLSKIMIFFMMPLYTSKIPVADMGIYDTNTTVITFFSSVLFLDIGSAILRYTLASKTEDDKKASLSNGIIIFFMSAVIYCTLLAIGGIFFDIQYYGWIVLYGLLYSVNTVIGQCTRALERNTDYAIGGIIQTAVLVVSNLIMILALNFDYSALMISFCISTTASTLYMLLRSSFFKAVKFKTVSKEKFKDIFKFSLPLCVNSIAFWFLSSSGRVILRAMEGPEPVGYLSIAGKFTQIIYLVSSCVQLTWQEIAFAHDNSKDDTGKFYSNGFSMYLKVILTGVVLAIPAIKIGLALFPGFINDSYAESLNLIPSALYGTGLAILSLFTGTIFSSIKKTGVIFVSTLAGAVANVGTNIGLILLGQGAYAVNYSFIIGYVVTILIRILILRKSMSFKVYISNIIIPTSLFLAVTAVYIFLNVWFSVIAFVLALAFALFYFRKEAVVLLKGIKKKGVSKA